MNRFTCLCHGMDTGRVCARLNCNGKPKYRIYAVHEYLICVKCWDEMMRKGYAHETGEWKTRWNDSGTAGQQ